MSDTPQETVHTPCDVEPDLTLGQRLRLTRESKKLSLSDVAGQLHFTVDRVERMENDDYTHAAALTYARGYLNVYARVLGLPHDEVMAAFDELDLGDQFGSSQPRSVLPKEMEEVIASGGHVRWGSYVIAVALVALVVLWWYGIKKPTPHATTPVVATRPAFTQVSSKPLAIVGAGQTTVGSEPHFGSAIRVPGAGDSKFGKVTLTQNLSSDKTSKTHQETNNKR